MSASAPLPPEVGELLLAAWWLLGVGCAAPLLVLLSLPRLGLVEWLDRPPRRQRRSLVRTLAEAWCEGGRPPARVRSSEPQATTGPARGRALQTIVALPLLLPWLPLEVVARLRRGALQLRHRQRQRYARAGYQALEEPGEPPPRWLVAGAARLDRQLRRLGIRDRLAIKLVGADRNALAYYFHGSQFAEERHVLRIRSTFLDEVARVLPAKPDAAGTTERRAALSAAYLMAHEYAHGIWELAQVLQLLRQEGSRLPATRYAASLLPLLGSWRAGPRGVQEAFCDDFAAFLVGPAPVFEADDSIPLRGLQAPALRRISAWHGRVLASLDEEGWAEVNRRGLLEARLPWVRPFALAATGLRASGPA